MKLIQLVCLFCFSLCVASGAKSDNFRNLIEDLKDPKEVKKLLKTKNNVLIIYAKTAKDATLLSSVYTAVANEVKGQATLAFVDCSGEGKKVCKKLKVSPEPLSLKHYKDGEFHKDYDRKETIKSMVNFLKNPTGEPPWEEEDVAKDVVHIPDASALGRLLNKQKLPLLIMFYVPWCGHCKRLKPFYAIAATELINHSVLAAMDLNKAENSVVGKHYNISGYPTLLYFENGNVKIQYDQGFTSKDIVEFMKNPNKQPKQKPKEEEWSSIESDVLHLTDQNFEETLKTEPSVLVMFYAPWCGHCKTMKPEYTDAAKKMKDDKIAGILAAVDATKEKLIAEKFSIKGYPSVKYFKNGELAFDANVRKADEIIDFMKDPKEPPPPPPPEIPWDQTSSDVVHLGEENFKEVLKRKKHVLVMFYAPWCGHCKKAKPEFQNAAAHFKDDPKVELAAIDCTVHSSICSTYDVKGYPTLKYFNYFKNSKPYQEGRTEKDFIKYLSGLQDPSKAQATSEIENWWSEVKGGEHLIQLKKDNIKDVLNKEQNLLVMFYAEWCGYCKKMKPHFAEAALGLTKEKETDCKMATVDAMVEKELATEYNIKGFPTVLFFRGGKMSEQYEGQPTSEDILSFIRSKVNPKQEL